MKNCLIVFARVPQKGRVKTRLQEYLPSDAVLKLYKAFLRDTFDLARAVPCSARVLAYDSASCGPGYLQQLAGDFKFYRQRGSDLGKRMHNAFRLGKRLDCDKTVIIGSDSPDLPPEYIKEAYRRLDDSDVVLGPSEDGGYYLVGLRDPCEAVFDRVQWSTPRAFDNTIKNTALLNKKVSVLDKWYDIDDYARLVLLMENLKKDPGAAPWTRKSLRL